MFLDLEWLGFRFYCHQKLIENQFSIQIERASGYQTRPKSPVIGLLSTQASAPQYSNGQKLSDCQLVQYLNAIKIP